MKCRTCVDRPAIQDPYADRCMDAACEFVAEDHVFQVPAGADVRSGASWLVE